MDNNYADRFIRLAEVKERTGISRSAIYAAVKDGTFPKPVQLGSRSIGWLESEITKWIDQRVQSSRQDPENG